MLYKIHRFCMLSLFHPWWLYSHLSNPIYVYILDHISVHPQIDPSILWLSTQLLAIQSHLLTQGSWAKHWLIEWFKKKWINKHYLQWIFVDLLLKNKPTSLPCQGPSSSWSWDPPNKSGWVLKSWAKSMSCRSVRGALRVSKIPLATFCFWCAIPRREVMAMVSWNADAFRIISCHVKCFLRAPITTSWYPHPNWIVLGSKRIGFATIWDMSSQLSRHDQDAQPLREKQKAWLEKNLDAAKSLGSGMRQYVYRGFSVLYYFRGLHVGTHSYTCNQPSMWNMHGKLSSPLTWSILSMFAPTDMGNRCEHGDRGTVSFKIWWLYTLCLPWW